MITGLRIFLQPGCSGVAIPFGAPGSGAVSEGSHSGYNPFPQALINYEAIAHIFGEDEYTDPEIPPLPTNPYGAQEVTYTWLYDSQDTRYKWMHIDSDDWYTYNPAFAFGQSPDYNWLGYLKICRIEQFHHSNQTRHSTSGGEPIQAGDNLLTYPECWGVDVQTVIRGPGVNDWYSLGDTGKFGWVSAHYDGLYWGPLQFLNFDSQRVIFQPG